MLSSFISLIFFSFFIAQISNPATISHSEKTPPNETHRAAPNASLNDFPQAQRTWGEVLNPQHLVPETGFYAFYINAQEPNKVVFQEHVDAIAINYAYQDFHQIPSEQFGAYWVGKITIPQSGLYRVYLDQSWAQSRVMLNKRVIISEHSSDKANSQTENTLFLTAGDYTLEVEHLNHWHTTSFQLSLAPLMMEYAPEALADLLVKQKIPEKTVIYAVGIYESAHQDNRVFLTIADNAPPYVLLLSSYRAVRWHIAGKQPEMVIYNRASAGSKVENFPPEKVFAWRGFIDDDLGENTRAHCNCAGGQFYCEDTSSLRTFAENVLQWTKLPLAGISGEYYAENIKVPNRRITAETFAEDVQKQRDWAEQKRRCQQKTPRSFEDFMPQN